MRRLIPVFCVLGACLAPAGARADTETRVTPTGSIIVSWHGDPARGCADHGVCDVRGSVVLDPSTNQGTSTASARPDGYLPVIDFQLDPAIVRVTRGPEPDPLGSCIDAMGQASVAFLPDRPVGRGGNVRLAATVGFGDAPLSAGRCAGPTAADLAEVLPSLRVPRSSFRRPRQRLDMTLQRSFGAGPFTVAVDSSVRVSVRRREVRRGSSTIFGREDRVRVRRRAVLSLSYTVDMAASPMQTSFSGLPGRGCEVLDACGLTGTSTVALAGGQRARVELRATGSPALARGGVRRALAALAAGRMTSESSGGDDQLRGRIDAEVRREGSPGVCRDGRDIELPPLDLRVGRTTSQLTIGSESYGGYGGVLRTRCPGLGSPASGPLAAGTLPTRDLGGSRLTVPVALVTGDSWPYAAAPTQSTTLTLRRVAARVRVERVPDV